MTSLICWVSALLHRRSLILWLPLRWQLLLVLLLGAQGCQSASGIAVAAPVAAAAAAGIAAGVARCLVASDTELEELRRNMESEDTTPVSVQGCARQDELVKGV